MASDPNYQKHQARIKIFCGPVQYLPNIEKFDLIISSVPFFNFFADLTKSILEKYQQIAKPHTKLKYFQYVAFKNILKTFPGLTGQRVTDLVTYLENQQICKPTAAKIVWLNFPPAQIICCSILQ